jgi:hypothetical protein
MHFEFGRGSIRSARGLKGVPPPLLGNWGSRSCRFTEHHQQPCFNFVRAATESGRSHNITETHFISQHLKAFKAKTIFSSQCKNQLLIQIFYAT